jgi:hypothetical protein
VKRGLITWDKTEIAPHIFEERLQRVRETLSQKELPAMVVYSELWRSNQARFLSNYMPYFNRAFLIIPVSLPVTLLCGLSPRVYRWIRSVTTIEDVRPAGNFARTLSQLAAERGWQRVGFLDFDQFPWDLHKAILAEPFGAVSISSAESLLADETELALRRKAAQMARAILTEELSSAIGQTDHEFVGRLERRLRRQGAEDLIILVTNGSSCPAPATGQTLGENFSVSLALEYRGHWVRVSRPHGFEGMDEWLLKPDSDALFENLGGSSPYEVTDRSAVRPGSIFAVHVERRAADKRVFYGDTFRDGKSGPELL